MRVSFKVSLRLHLEFFESFSRVSFRVSLGFHLGFLLKSFKLSLGFHSRVSYQDVFSRFLNVQVGSFRVPSGLL